MKRLLPTVLVLLSASAKAQTSKEIQGTWRMISTVITSPNNVFKMDSSTHNLTKQIGDSTFNFKLYGKKTPALVTSGHGTAMTDGNKYIEKFIQATTGSLLVEPMVFTYRVAGRILTYEGGRKDLHIVETLMKVE